MVSGKLADRIHHLSKADKYYLYLQLKDEVGGLPQTLVRIFTKESVFDRAKAYAQIIEEQVGVDVFSQGRAFPTPHCRMVVATQLAKDGYTTLDIGKALGRDHSTIIYYRDTIEAIINMPACDPRVFTIWSNFQKSIQYETTDTSTIGNPATI